MDDSFPDTRLFVSGLPPNFTGDELGKHFAGRYQITDAQVIPGRRIGFVGFRNYTLAKSAIQYFDKSYIRMSKIHVEFAKPPGQTDVDRETRNTRKPLKLGTARSSINSTSTLKDARNIAGNKEVNLEEQAGEQFKPYEPVLTTPHSLKRKLNVVEAENKGTSQDASTTRNRTPIVTDTVQSVDKAEKTQRKEQQVNVNDHEAVSAESDHKKPKKKKGGEERKGKAMKDEESLEQSPEVGGDSPSQNTVQLHERVSDSDKPAPQTTDDEWLRAKISQGPGLFEKNDVHRIKQSMDSVGTTVDHSSKDAIDSAKETHIPPIKLIFNDADKFASSNGRLFLRNIPFGSTETDIEDVFSAFGTIEEAHVVRDFDSGLSKGLAYLQFKDSDAATRATDKMNGRTFQGRLLKILPAAKRRSYPIDKYALSRLPLKKQKALKKKMETNNAHLSWNSLYMNPDAVVASVAERLGVSKSDIIDPSAADAAVKQAHAETHIIQETKTYFSANGVNLNALQNKTRGGTALLVKNLAYGTTPDEITSMFQPFGQIRRLLFPPSGALAIVDFAANADVHHAISGLAYRNHRGSVLYLERAPANLFKVNDEKKVESNSSGQDKSDLVGKDMTDKMTQPCSTLFVTNLNFTTTSTGLTELCRPLQGFLSAKVKTKMTSKEFPHTLSMGYGFVEFKNAQDAKAGLQALNGSKLDGHQLVVRFAQRSSDVTNERSRNHLAQGSKTKVVIKNLPFETTKKEVRALFGPYGQLRSVRVPKKFDRSTRGFAFAEFVSAKEAANAIDALKDTHLLGRRLVLEFAAEDAIDPEQEIQAIEERVSKQTDAMNLKKIKGSGRKKFNVDAQDVE